MGYDTNFCGSFELDKPLSKEHKDYLSKFSETRRVKRKQTVASKMADPVRIAAGLPIGKQGAYFVGGLGFAGQDDDASVIEGNTPPDGQPGLWCQWVPSNDGTAIVWDGSEKFYNYVEWIKYLVENFIKPWGYVLNGEVEWSGDDADDRGLICIDNNVVKIKVARITYEEFE
jgi:hypothetical protein